MPPSCALGINNFSPGRYCDYCTKSGTNWKLNWRVQNAKNMGISRQSFPNCFRVRGHCSVGISLGRVPKALGGTEAFHTLSSSSSSLNSPPTKNKEYSMKTIKIRGRTTQTGQLSMNSSDQSCLFHRPLSVRPWFTRLDEVTAGEAGVPGGCLLLCSHLSENCEQCVC